MKNRKEPDDVRAGLLQIRLNAAERAELDAAAKRDDRPVSSWARVQLLKAARAKGGK